MRGEHRVIEHLGQLHERPWEEGDGGEHIPIEDKGYEERGGGEEDSASSSKSSYDRDIVCEGWEHIDPLRGLTRDPLDNRVRGRGRGRGRGNRRRRRGGGRGTREYNPVFFCTSI